MITYEDKDTVLRVICENNLQTEMLLPVNRKVFVDATGLDEQTVHSVLCHFQSSGLISRLNYRFNADSFYMVVHTKAADIFRRGGFAMKEYLLEQEVEKLLLEVERLKPSLGDKIEKISTIVSNIANIIKPF